jgi:hypothetical protein
VSDKTKQFFVKSKSIFQQAFPLAFLLMLIFSNLEGCNLSKGIRAGTIPAVTVTVNIQPPPKPHPTKTIAEPRNTQIEAILAAYSFEQEFSHLVELASDKYKGRRAGDAGARAAADYIFRQFSNVGLKPWVAAGLGSYTQHFSIGEIDSDNIIGMIPGTSPQESYIILGAHYDHLGLDVNGNVFNGADDNAAGVAAMLEAARIFQRLNLKPKKTIVFCAFSGEEEKSLGAISLGQLLVSKGLAQNTEIINIDGIGATGGSYFGVWDEGTPAAAPLVQALKSAGHYLGTPVKEEGTDIGSDAQSLAWQFHIPAVTVDWSWGQDESFFHPYYHTIYDDADKIDKNVLAKATKVAIIGLWLRAS